MVTTPIDVSQLIYVKTNIGGWFFDAFLSINHESKLTITDHPIQSGSSITDHAFLESRTLTFEIGMSDAAKDFVPGQFEGGWKLFFNFREFHKIFYGAADFF